MKKLLLLWLLLFSGWSGFAQHCPFDAAHLVVIKLIDHEGNIITDSTISLVLAETDNPIADSCKHDPGLLELPFSDISFTLNQFISRTPPTYINSLTKDCSFMEKGNQAVILSQSQYNCVIPKDGDYNYIKRKFEIRIYKSNKLIQSVHLDAESIYELCTSYGPWSRIQTKNIVVE